MIRRWLADPEKRKLALSLSTNFATRIPGAVGIVAFLPMLRFGLGTDAYSTLLASISLGAAATFLSGGFSLIGRRLIGEAFAASDYQGEADGFASLVAVSLFTFLLSVALIGLYCLARGSQWPIVFASILPAVVVFFNTFDNVRAAYNEHYVTASLQFFLQIFVYILGFTIPAVRHSLILAALVLQVHYLIASLIAVVLLLKSRPYLLRGRLPLVWQVTRGGILLGMADGFLMATLSLAVVWLQVRASAATVGWFATNVRVFQTFLVPVVLLLMPLSSYVRMTWNNRSFDSQKKFAVLTVASGMGYGLIVSISLLFASKFYVTKLLHLPAPGGLIAILPIFFLFGAIVTYKSYSSIAYLVLEVVHLSAWTTAALVISLGLALVTGLVEEPLVAIDVYAVTAGGAMIGILLWNVLRFLGSSPTTGVVGAESAT